MKLYPSLRYKDAKAAHQWLQDAFGFEPAALHEDDTGYVAHAEMRWGDDLIMFGTAREDHYGERVGQGWVYATCDDPDALYARAKAAGAEVTMELTDQEYGSRDFAVRDLAWRAISGTSVPTSLLSAGLSSSVGSRQAGLGRRGAGTRHNRQLWSTRLHTCIRFGAVIDDDRVKDAHCAETMARAAGRDVEIRSSRPIAMLIVEVAIAQGESCPPRNV